MKTITLALFLSALAFSSAQQDYQLQYLAPGDLVEVLDCRKTEGKNYLFDVDNQTVQLYLNSSTNRVRLMGEETALNTAVDIIKFLDIAPRQFLIQVEIIEINDQSLQDIGWDWQSVLEEIPLTYNWDLYNYDSEQTNTSSGTTDETVSNIDRSTNTMSITAGSIRLTSSASSKRTISVR
ncbi:MAG: hypothetical protein GXO91_09275 [FCB group bacterium]|nr:hypothetical protein [FCB group bacterium]